MQKRIRCSFFGSEVLRKDILITRDRAKIRNAVEGNIIGVVVGICAVERGAAKINDVISVKLKIHVLKSNLFNTRRTVIQKVGC